MLQVGWTAAVAAVTAVAATAAVTAAVKAVATAVEAAAVTAVAVEGRMTRTWTTCCRGCPPWTEAWKTWMCSGWRRLSTGLTDDLHFASGTRARRVGGGGHLANVVSFVSSLYKSRVQSKYQYDSLRTSPIVHARVLISN